jgi:hypothetical protein
MPLTAAQIVALACAKAKTPGMIVSAGQQLNTILEELCRTYDIAAARTTTSITFNQGANGTNSGIGPYLLPANYLRTQHGKQFYLFNGQPYWMIKVEQWEYDSFIQQPGFNDFPRNFFVDVSPLGTGGVPQEFIWPPPSLSATVTVHYFQLMPDITAPESSTVIPWFPFQNYLITRLAGQMMQDADDDRAEKFLTDKEELNPQGAGVLLRRFLNLKDDPEGITHQVSLDERRFGRSQWANLPNTKTIGW